MSPSRRLAVKRIVVVLTCALIFGLEFYVVFVNRDGEFRIQGNETFDLTEFGSGAVVSHAFLMRGDGLNSVAVQFGSNSRVQVNVQWTLWRGMADQPAEMSRAFEGTELVDLRPGHQWRTFEFTRDASSRDRWYTIEVKSLAIVRPGPPAAAGDVPPEVALVATHDNPDRGGVLWVNGARRPGSLFMTAGRQGRTPYRRFVAEAEPHLPAFLRIRAVQWIVVIAVHGAFLVFAWAVLGDAGRRHLGADRQ